MKKIIIGLFLMAYSCYNYGQTSLVFCTSVEKDGYCYFNNNKFIAQQDSATSKIFMQIKSTPPSTIGATKVTYKIYTVNAKGEEAMVTSIDQNVAPDWMFVWMPYSFDAGSKYDVKIYNELNQLVCSKSLELLKW